MPARSLQSEPPDKRQGSGDAGTYSDVVPTRNCPPAFCSQAPALALMRFSTLPAVCPLEFEDSTARPAPPHIWRDFLRPLGWGLLPFADAPTRLAAARQAGPPGTRDRSLWEDGVQSALGPGSWLQCSELTEVCLFIICLG